MHQHCTHWGHAERATSATCCTARALQAAHCLRTSYSRLRLGTEWLYTDIAAARLLANTVHKPTTESETLVSCLIYGQPFRHTSSPWPTPISLTACTHFSARLGAFFYWTRCFENNVPFDNTAQIYLINLHWKLGLGFKLRLRVAIF